LFLGVASVFAFATAVIPMQGQNNLGQRQGSPRLVRQIGLVSLVVLLLGLLALASLAAAVWVEAIDLSRYRFFGFQEETLFNASVESRVAILNRNFALQLQHSPLLGNMFVDRATTGDGTYAHSLIALLPHLGIVGTALFVAMSGAVFIQLRQQWKQSISSAGYQRLTLFGVVIVAWVFAFMLASTFFTNIIVWFSLGSLAPAVQLIRTRAA
jgi:O-antigen ligase